MHICTNPPTKHKFIKNCLEFFKINCPLDKSHNRFIESFIWKANHRKLFTSLRLIIFCYFCLIFLLRPAGLCFCVLNSILCLIIFPVCQDHWVWMQFFEHNHTLLPMEEAGGGSREEYFLLNICFFLFVKECTMQNVSKI